MPSITSVWGLISAENLAEVKQSEGQGAGLFAGLTCGPQTESAEPRPTVQTLHLRSAASLSIFSYSAIWTEQEFLQKSKEPMTFFACGSLGNTTLPSNMTE